MQNKKIRIFLRAVLVFFAAAEFSLEAQSYYSSRKRQKSVSTVSRPQQKQKAQNSRSAVQRKSSPAVAPVVHGGGTEQFDPRKPALKAESYNSVVTRIRKELLERKFSGTFKEDSKENDFWKNNSCYTLVFHFRKLANNVEAPEVTSIHPDWFKQYRSLLQAFDPINRRIRYAVANKNREMYGKYIKQFQAQQKTCLDFLKTRPPRMTPEQRANLRMKNSQMRLKRYRERMKK